MTVAAVVGRIIPDVRDRLARRRAARIEQGERADADQRMGCKMTVAQVIERAPQRLILIGQKLDHDGFHLLASLETQRSVQSGMHGYASRIRELRRFGSFAHGGIYPCNHSAQQVRMDRTDHTILRIVGSTIARHNAGRPAALSP